MSKSKKTEFFIGDHIAKHLIQTYDIQPYFLNDGTLGLHFMELSASIEMIDKTLRSQILDFIDAHRMPRFENTLDRSGLSDLRHVRSTLIACIDALDEAIKEMEAL